jgi:hypothetical protein
MVDPTTDLRRSDLDHPAHARARALAPATRSSNYRCRLSA